MSKLCNRAVYATACVVLLLSMLGLGGSILFDSVLAKEPEYVDVYTEADIKNNLPSGQMLRLANDIVLNEPLTVADGASHTIDLQGFDLKRNVAPEGFQNGSVIVINNKSTLTIQDSNPECTGDITGGYALRGGGVRIEGDSQLNMLSGNIRGNFGCEGGGIYIGSGKAVITKTNIIGNNGYEIFDERRPETQDYLNKKQNFYQNPGLAKDSSGGGIRVESGGVCELSNSTVNNNGAGSGGGIFNQGTLELVKCEVVNNDIIDEEYGGKRLGAGIYTVGRTTLNDVDITTNTDALHGGGVYAEGQVVICDCDISNNTAQAKGGGLYTGYTGHGSISFTGKNKIEQNGAQLGGGMFICPANDAANNSRVSLEKIELKSNFASDQGGAVLAGPDLGDLAITDVKMEGNVSGGNGGAIYSYATINMTNSTISGNTATNGKGGGIYADYEGKKNNLLIKASSITDNICKDGGGGIWMQDNNKQSKLTLDGGKIIIYRNKKDSNDNNIMFSAYREIKITGKFASESMIGVLYTDKSNKRRVTKDYGDYNKEPIDTFFAYDGDDYKVSDDEKQSEVILVETIRPSAKGYTVHVKIKVTDDANDWHSAQVSIYGKDKNGAAKDDKYLNGTRDISKYIDEGGEVYENDFDCGTTFPTEVVIFTDFNTSKIVHRSFGADVEIKINKVNVSSEKIKVAAWGNTFKAGVADSIIKIGGIHYPYLAQYEVKQKREINLADDATKEVSIYGVNQYGVEWQEPGTENAKMTNLSFPGEDTAKCTGGQGLKWKLDSSKMNECHNSTYLLQFKSGNNVFQWSSIVITVRFRIPLYVTIKVGNDSGYKEVKKLSGKQNETIRLSIPDVPKGYKVASAEKEGVCLLAKDDEGNYDLTLQTENVVVRFVTTPIKYKVSFKKNVSDAKLVQGNILNKTVVYDTALILPACTYKFKDKSREFANWNTKEDGSGQSYGDKEKVKNLTSVDGEVVNLYAQWKDQNGNLVTASLFSKGTIAIWIGIGVFAAIVIVICNVMYFRRKKKSNGGD